MADQTPSSRSRVAILSIVGGVILLAAILPFVPLLKCPECGGTGFRTVQVMTFAPAKTSNQNYPCHRCEGNGRLSLRRRMASKHDEEVLKSKMELALTPGGREISEINYEGL